MNKPNLSRRKLFPSVAAIWGVSILGLSFGRKAFAEDLIPFKVGLSALANTCLAIWMAKDAGFYKEQGLDFSMQQMAGGAQAGPELKGGNIQAMHIGSSSVVRANASGYDLRTVASLRNVLSFTMFTKADVKTASALKGGTVGISSFGSESDATLGLVLGKLGLTRDDVTVKELGLDRLQALQNGAITASMLNEPWRSQALQLGLNPIVDPLADQTPWVFTGLVVDNSYMKTHREVLIKFLKATVEGNFLALSDEKRAKTVLARELKLTDQKIVDLAYADFKKWSPINIEVSREGTRNIIDQVAKGGASRNIDDYVDESLMKSIDQQGFLNILKKKYTLA